jgi:hypothetical protein
MEEARQEEDVVGVHSSLRWVVAHLQQYDNLVALLHLHHAPLLVLHRLSNLGASVLVRSQAGSNLHLQILMLLEMSLMDRMQAQQQHLPRCILEVSLEIKTMHGKIAGHMGLPMA